ncbi:class I SAM-dependent methyltransferase [Desulfobacula sp.]|uniref:class I SAM-dependent methyltransferase n=1 Tax=Desulfobacula sp. TaxID=2593537 RepID=UPI00262E4C9E|nr:class I SAM-dependent methyltransferase [Desulfobacula sp.]
MSKLESFIRRMTAQRDCLNHTVELIKDLPGIVFELGLGNGRSYNHLCQILPEREIYVFDRRIASFPSCTPPEDHLFIGEVTHTLLKAAKVFGKKVAMVHVDLGTSDTVSSKQMMSKICPLLEPLVLPGAVIVSDTEFHGPVWEKIPGPMGIKKDRYFLYQTSSGL